MRRQTSETLPHWGESQSSLFDPKYFASWILRMRIAAMTVARRRLPVSGGTSSETATSGSLYPRTVLFLLVFNTSVLEPDLNLQANRVLSLVSGKSHYSENSIHKLNAYFVPTFLHYGIFATNWLTRPRGVGGTSPHFFTLATRNELAIPNRQETGFIKCNWRSL